MKTSQTLQRACQVLRRRVRYKNAGLNLDGKWGSGNKDTKRIQEATRIYVESWIVPILDSIESGDTAALARFIAGDRGDKIESENRTEVAS